MTWTDRVVLTAASRLLPRSRWPSLIVTPQTIPWTVLKTVSAQASGAAKCFGVWTAEPNLVGDPRK